MLLWKIVYDTSIFYHWHIHIMHPLQVLLELAKSRNKAPLPKSIAGAGIHLPPEKDTLIAPNYQLAIPRKQNIQQVEETEEDEETADPSPNPSQERRNLTQGTLERVSFQLGAKHPR